MRPNLGGKEHNKHRDKKIVMQVAVGKQAVMGLCRQQLGASSPAPDRCSSCQQPAGSPDQQAIFQGHRRLLPNPYTRKLTTSFLRM